MTIIRQFTSSENKPTAIKADGDYLWVAYTAQSGVSTIKKVIATDLSQVAIDLDITVNAINAITVNSTYVFLAYDDSVNLGQRYIKANPFSTIVSYAKPAEVVEEAVDCLVTASYIYFLSPGNLSGQNAIISQFTLAGTFVQIIDLSTAVNATSFIMDSNNEIQVVTFTNPCQLIRVYNLATTPQFSTTLITD